MRVWDMRYADACCISPSLTLSPSSVLSACFSVSISLPIHSPPPYFSLAFSSSHSLPLSLSPPPLTSTITASPNPNPAAGTSSAPPKVDSSRS